MYNLFMNLIETHVFLSGGSNDLLDGETTVPLVFSTDFDINKLWKNGNGVQVVFIESSQVNKPKCVHVQSEMFFTVFVCAWKVGIISDNGAAILSSSPIANEIADNDQPSDLPDLPDSRNLSDAFHVETPVGYIIC